MTISIMIHLHIYEHLFCSKDCSSLDTAILDKSWEKDKVKQNIISIKMYAFRFPESTKVEIECTAHFCPESDTKCEKKVTRNYVLVLFRNCLHSVYNHLKI